jgi:hypothetical protein
MKVNWKNLFLKVAAICFALQFVGAIISIVFSMPAQVVFGGTALDPQDATPALVAQELLSKGTALAPPLFLTVLFGIMLFLASRKRVLGVIGTILLILVGFLFTMATTGEYANPNRYPNMPGAIYVFLLLLNSTFIIGTSLTGVLSLVFRRNVSKEKTLEV